MTNEWSRHTWGVGMLTVDGLSVDYDGVIALRDARLHIAEGEVVALVGANGAGKSSLLAAISGLHRPVGGSVVFQGREIAHLPAHRIAPMGLAMVPEGRRLFGHLTVHKNLLLGAYHQRDDEQRRDDLAYVFNLLPLLQQRLKQPAGTLSGGEQQMVALGRALMSRPRLLMLDEPSLGLAPIIVERLFEALRTVRDLGTTILLIEQNLRLALEFASRAYVLQSGQVVTSGPTEELRESEEVRRAYLGI